MLYRLETLMISRLFCILMFLIIAFEKSFMNATMIFCFELFGQEHKFKTCFGFFNK